MSHVGLYPGSFDPVTNGHLDVIRRACFLVDDLHIAVGTHHDKTGLFSAAERQALLEASLASLDLHGARVRIDTFDGLVVTAMKAVGASILIRGLRDTTDYNYEMQMAGMNATLAPEIQIVFVPSSPQVRHISASLVRQIARMGGDISDFVPPPVTDAIAGRMGH